jgi:glycosyltransferase involved in cell wall biosynthesis
MRILFIAKSDSIHTARWISQINDQGWDIHLFPSDDHGVINDELKNVIVHHSIYNSKTMQQHPLVKFKGAPVPSDFLVKSGIRFLKDIFPNYRKLQLHSTIKRLRPDIIQSLEFQSAGYLALEVKKEMNQHFPAWIATNWGSDLYLYGRLQQHRDRIREVLSECDYYSCECQRDVDLARSLGFKGQVLPVIPNAGGYDISRIREIIDTEPPSNRKVILLKGYQGIFGRALVGLHAIRLSAPFLNGYKVIIYSTWKDDAVRISAELLSQDTGLFVEVAPPESHENMLRLFGQAKIYLGLSISDAISTSLLESMIMGAFPIQSNTSSADEWISDGETGFIVPPEDSEGVAKAIRQAVTDDELVDKAALINFQTAKDRLDISVIKPKVIAMYEEIFAKAKKRNHS